MDRVAEVLAALREEEKTLRAELSRVERAIAALEQALGPDAAVRPQPAPVVPAPAPAPPLTGPYSEMTCEEAARTYLASAGEPKTVREIAAALVAGGYRTKSGNFMASVRMALARARHSNGLEPTPDGSRWFVQR